MGKPRIFLGSSGKRARGTLDDILQSWDHHTGERLLELAHEVEFAAFAFARDDWTRTSPPASPLTGSGQASPRDNVVFEAGLPGGALGMRRTLILHASGANLPSDLLGLTCVRYGEATTPTEMRAVNQKLRKAIENEGRVARIEGLWWLELGAGKSSVHDHGPCWVVHGNYRNPTRMRRWRRDDGRRPRHAEMEPHREFKEYGLVGHTGGER